MLRMGPRKLRAPKLNNKYTLNDNYRRLNRSYLVASIFL